VEETGVAPYRRTIDDVAAELKSDITQGLTSGEAQRRLAAHGPNELVEGQRISPLRLLWGQVTSTMVLILIAAAVLSAFLGKATEAAAIAAIVILFVTLGFFQEYRAEQAMAALRKLATPNVRVRRDGRWQELSARALVPGDLVWLEAGSAVPADLRLTESVNLRVQEAALTGESEPVDKNIEALTAAELPLGDRRNMAYMGTTVSYGRGAGLVVATGMETELGRIASLIQNVATGATPLQRRLDAVGRLLAVGGVLVALLVMLIGWLSGETLSEMVLTGVSVAVAVVPEGLPAVVTVTLALGAQRMLRRRALVRKLPAVETLGAVTVICSDKTGTLTENRMTVTIIDVAGDYLELQGTARHPAPTLRKSHDPAAVLRDGSPAIALTLAGGALCNDASLEEEEGDAGRVRTLGDPTEGALLVAAAEAGLSRAALEDVLPRVAEHPFDSERKRMTTVHALPEANDPLPWPLRPLVSQPGAYLAITKGSVDGLLPLCRHVWADNARQPLDERWFARIDAAHSEMAGNGMRVLGLALQWLDEATAAVEQEMVFLGLVGMIDPPRPEVKEAVAVCRAAGIRPVMITGDHRLTARFIATELGITENGQAITGQDLEAMTDAELAAALQEASVFARVSPADKLRIVEMLQAQGHVVAMTGDGVNDSPALRRADIGIAMGITGTDVAKEASEMVLVDDNFATIVAAVEEGRVIYDNIRRFVKFSIAGNIGKVLVMVLAPFAGMTVALLPLQLLWLNLLTDGLLGLGLGVEPPEKNTMQQPPRDPEEGLFSGGLGRHVLWVGALIGALALGVGALYRQAGADESTWRTIIFSALAFMQVGQALASRSSRESLGTLGLRSNLVLLVTAVVVVLLQLMVIYLPALDQFFEVTPLAPAELLLAAGLGLLVTAAIEVEKGWYRRSASR
jgi:Ca2+-transporting ATPase